jgi:hypothetical protein
MVCGIVILLQDPKAMMVGATVVSIGLGANASASSNSIVPDLEVSLGIGVWAKTGRANSKAQMLTVTSRVALFMNLDSNGRGACRRTDLTKTLLPQKSYKPVHFNLLSDFILKKFAQMERRGNEAG